MKLFSFLLHTTFPVMLTVGMTGHAADLSIKDTTKWIVEKSSGLGIVGRTNISHFACQIPDYAAPDTINFIQPCKGENTGIAMQGSVRLTINDFDCHDPFMTNEFRKTLRYRQYPVLVISFINLERMPKAGGDEEALKGWVEVTLAGVSRKFEISYASLRPEEGTLLLAGSRKMGFSDFRLIPPKKMCGLVKVNDALDVQFTLILQKIETEGNQKIAKTFFRKK